MEIPLILGSSSPYRKMLLDKLQLDFDCISPDINEDPIEGEQPEQLVQRLATEKAQAVAKLHPTPCRIIGSDQLAVLGDQVIGKPHTYENAFAQLRNASGQKVTFLTGLTLLNSQTETTYTCVEPFSVTFRELSDEMIHSYLTKEEPLNCAGSFKSEGLGITLFEKMSGEDPNSLIGLPLIKLCSFLKEDGASVL